MIVVLAVALVLIGAAFAYVLRPLLQPERFAAADGPATAAEQHAEARQAIYRAIRELDLDFSLGKLTEVDYRQQRSQLEHRALALLRREDEDLAETALAAEVEREVAALRAANRPQPPEGSHQADEQARLTEHGPYQPLPRCPRCGQVAREDDRFCSRCGRPLAEEALA